VRLLASQPYVPNGFGKSAPALVVQQTPPSFWVTERRALVFFGVIGGHLTHTCTTENSSQFFESPKDLHQMF